LLEYLGVRITVVIIYGVANEENTTADE